MYHRLILSIFSLGIVNAQFGYPKNVPSKQLEYDQKNQKYETFDEEQSNEAIPGEPGQDYPAYDEVPKTRFNCNDQQFPGYYADPEAKCQVFHICQRGGRKDSFLCPKGTVFNQEFLVCDWWYNVDCKKAVQLYKINEMIYNAMEEATYKKSELQASKNNYNSAINQGYTSPPKTTYGVPDKALTNRYQQSATSKPNLSLNSPTTKPLFGVPLQGLVNNIYSFNNPKPTYGTPEISNNVNTNTYLPPNNNGNGPQNSFDNGKRVEADEDEAIDLIQPVVELEALKQSEESSRSYLPPI